MTTSGKYYEYLSKHSSDLGHYVFTPRWEYKLLFFAKGVKVVVLYPYQLPPPTLNCSHFSLIATMRTAELRREVTPLQVPGVVALKPFLKRNSALLWLDPRNDFNQLQAVSAVYGEEQQTCLGFSGL